MITAREIRHALKELIEKKAGLPYDVSFNRIEKSEKSYIWIDLRHLKNSIDDAYFQRTIGVDINVILFPDDYATVIHDDLWDIADKLTVAVMPCVKIETEDGNKSKNRYITVQDFSTYIVDDVLHYEFKLEFTDYVPSNKYEETEYELMENLDIDLKEETVTYG